MLALSSNGVSTGLWHGGGGVYDERTMRVVSGLTTASGPVPHLTNLGPAPHLRNPGPIGVGDPNIIGDPNQVGDPNIIPNGIGDPGLVPSGIGDPNIMPNGIGDPGIMPNGVGDPNIMPNGIGDPGIVPSGIGDPNLSVALNPQPFPPAPGDGVALNPQPFPPSPGRNPGPSQIGWKNPGPTQIGWKNPGPISFTTKAVDAFIWFNPMGSMETFGKVGGGGGYYNPNISKAFDIKEWSFDVENPTTIGSATSGAGGGKAEFAEFSLTEGRHALPTETVSFVYGKLGVRYFPQKKPSACLWCPQ
jgi:hypothetical protein